MTRSLGKYNDKSSREEKTIIAEISNETTYRNTLSNYYKVSDGKDYSIFLGIGAIYFQSPTGLTNILPDSLKTKYSSKIPVLKLTNKGQLVIINPGLGDEENYLYGFPQEIAKWELFVNSGGIFVRNGVKIVKIYPLIPMTSNTTFTDSYFFSDGSSIRFVNGKLTRFYGANIEVMKDSKGVDLDGDKVTFINGELKLFKLNTEVWKLVGFNNTTDTCNMTSSGIITIGSLQVYPYRNFPTLTLNTNGFRISNFDTIGTYPNILTIEDGFVKVSGRVLKSLDPKIRPVLEFVNLTGSNAYIMIKTSEIGYYQLLQNDSFLPTPKGGILTYSVTDLGLFCNGIRIKSEQDNYVTELKSGDILGFNYLKGVDSVLFMMPGYVLKCYNFTGGELWSLNNTNPSIDNSFFKIDIDGTIFYGFSKLPKATATKSTDTFRLELECLYCGPIPIYQSSLFPYYNKIGRLYASENNTMTKFNTLNPYESYKSITVEYGKLTFLGIDLLPYALVIKGYPIPWLKPNGDLEILEPMTMQVKHVIKFLGYEVPLLTSINPGIYYMETNTTTKTIYLQNGPTSYQLYPPVSPIIYYDKLSTDTAKITLQNFNESLRSPNKVWSFHKDIDNSFKIFKNEQVYSTFCYGIDSNSYLSIDTYGLLSCGTTTNIGYGYTLYMYYNFGFSPKTLYITDEGYLSFNGILIHNEPAKYKLISNTNTTSDIATNNNLIRPMGRMFSSTDGTYIYNPTVNSIAIYNPLIGSSNILVNSNYSNTPYIRLNVLGDAVLYSSYSNTVLPPQGFVTPGKGSSDTSTPFVAILSNGCLWSYKESSPEADYLIAGRNITNIYYLEYNSTLLNTYRINSQLGNAFASVNRLGNFVTCSAPQKIVDIFNPLNPTSQNNNLAISSTGVISFGGKDIVFTTENGSISQFTTQYQPTYCRFSIDNSGRLVVKSNSSENNPSATIISNKLREFKTTLVGDDDKNIDILTYSGFTSYYISYPGGRKSQSMLMNNEIVQAGNYKLSLDKGKVLYFNGTTLIDLLSLYKITIDYFPVLKFNTDGTFIVTKPGTENTTLTTGLIGGRFGLSKVGMSSPPSLVLGDNLLVRYSDGTTFNLTNL